MHAQRGHHLFAGGAAGPVRGAGRVGGDVAFLLHRDQIVEAALLVDLDHARLELRRARMLRMALDEGGEGAGGVGEAQALQQHLAERGVDQRVEARLRVAREILVHRRTAAEHGEGEAGDAQRILGEIGLALGHGLERGIDVLQLAGRQLAVEDGEEHRQRLVELRLLEQRPAVLVLRRLEERRLAGEGHHRRVFDFGFFITLQAEQQLRAAEMGVACQLRVRMPAVQLGERVHRLGALAGVLVGARQLIEHAVVVRVVRALREQLPVEADGVRQQLVALRTAAAAGVVHLHLQVGHAAQGLGTHRLVGREFEDLAVVLQRLLGVGRDGVGEDDRQLVLVRRLLLGQLPDRRALVLRTQVGLRPAGGDQRRGGERRDGEVDTAHRASPFRRSS